MTLDILATAAAMAPRIGAGIPQWKVCAATDSPVPLSNGMHVDAKRLPRRPESDGSVWIVPGLGPDSLAGMAQRLSQSDALEAAQALRVQARAGGTVAASCAAVFLLQAAGLLVDRKATTTWWLASQLQRVEPRCKVDAHRMVISDGPIWTAGAALAQTDLMLQLLRTRFGPALADAVSRVLLIDAREAQSPFVIPAMLASGDEFIARLSAQIDAALPQAPSVARLAATFCVSERTLARRVRAATGQSPLGLIQCVRLQKARMLLETSRMTVDQVAEQVGYGDATALRRLMRKVSGATPRQFRSSVSASTS